MGMDMLMMVFELLRRLSLSACVLIAAVSLTRILLIHRLPKRTFSMLWTICALRAVIPVFPKFTFSIQNLIPGLLSRTFVGNASLLNGETGWTVGAGTADGMMETGMFGTQIAGGTSHFTGLAGIWFVGTILLGMYFLTSYVKYRRIFSMSLPLEQDVSREKRLMRRVQIRVSDRIDAPLSYGLFRPVILFPSAMDWEDREAVEMILDHEMIHIRRLDGLQKGILALAFCLHWWNPLIWVMFFFGNRDAELACDEAVVLAGDRDLRSAYAMILIRMEERRSSCGALYSHFSQNAIEERITAIMKIKKTSGLALVCAICLVVGLTAVFGTNAPETGPEESSFLWPVEGCETITMRFGERTHPVTGEVMVVDHITISDSEGGAQGAKVRASKTGTVKEAEYDSILGNYLIIDHGDGSVTKYTHCEELWTEVGESVTQGETIGSVGATGRATGSCLGFYVYLDGEPVDPELYL